LALRINNTDECKGNNGRNQRSRKVVRCPWALDSLIIPSTSCHVP
jgi:hypothetical protein